MEQPLLWIEQNAEAGTVSSAKKDSTRIRRHVQSHRREHNASRRQASDSEHCHVVAGSQQDVDVMETSSNPEAKLVSTARLGLCLGRLVTTKQPPSNRRRKRKSKDHCSRAIGSDKPTSTGPASGVPQTLPWLWHGLSSDERRTLAFFELRTSQEWTGYEDAFFWNVLALQVSHQSPAVARNLVAVAAFHESQEAVGSVEKTRLQRISYHQSSKATEGLIARTNMSHFEALVSCLVMICFHGLKRSRASFVLLRSGMRMLQEYDERGQVSLQEAHMIETHIRPLFDRLVTAPCRMGGVLEAFVLSVKKQRSKQLASITDVPSIPSTFDSLLEAKHGLQLVLNWAHDNMPAQPGPSVEQPFLDSLSQQKVAWETALEQSSLPCTPATIRSRKLLRAACLVGVIIVETATSLSETIFDKYLVEFQEILDLIERAKLTLHSFGIDSGLLDIVAFVGSKCRDPLTRRRALRLLNSGDRLEGDRIAANPAKIMECLIGLEERDLEVSSCHDIPEEMRRRLVYGHQLFAQRQIDLFYATGDGQPKERCCVSLAGSSDGKIDTRVESERSVPDAIFGSGYAAYLEDRETMSYFRLELDRFYFPIPKV